MRPQILFLAMMLLATPPTFAVDEGVTDDPAIRAAEDTRRALAADPYNSDALTRFRRDISRVSHKRAHAFYLATYYMGTLSGRDIETAKKTLGDMKEHHPESHYIETLAPERFTTRCLTCHGAGESRKTCPTCAGSARCKICQGRKRVPGLDKKKPCPACNATGRCPKCNRHGRVLDTCPKCGGRKRILSDRKIMAAYKRLLNRPLGEALKSDKFVLPEENAP